KDNILSLLDHYATRLGWFKIIILVTINNIVTHNDIFAVFDHNIPIVSSHESIPNNTDTSAVIQINIEVLISDMVPGNTPQSYLIGIAVTSDESDVGSSGTVDGLDGIARYRPLPYTAPLLTAVNQNICGNNTFWVTVIFDIISGDLKISDRTTRDFNSSLFTITDVAVANDELVDIDII